MSSTSVTDFQTLGERTNFPLDGLHEPREPGRPTLFEDEGATDDDGTTVDTARRAALHALGGGSGCEPWFSSHSSPVDVTDASGHGGARLSQVADARLDHG